MIASRFHIANTSCKPWWAREGLILIRITGSLGIEHGEEERGKK
jgi:hypothetical protein